METARRIAARPDRKRVLLAAVALVPALAATIAAGHATAAGTGAKVKVEQTALGRILVNGQGRTLYMFALDKHGKSACYGTCARFWPPLLTTSSRLAGAAGVKASLLGTSMRKGGTLQVTYAGHPLYTFLKDAGPGQTNGQGLNASGGLWWAISPTGAVIKKTMSTPSTSTPAGTTTTGGGGGGWG